MNSPFPDHKYPADPYPGARPDFSFVHSGSTGYRITPDVTSPSGWVLHESHGALDLDEWLSARQVAPLRTRLPVLAYGSNSNPEKISWLRTELGLQGPAIVLRAECSGIAAVWSAGIRARDDQRPAVLAAAPGSETHAVWLVTPDQRRVLDECEGRGQRYRLSWVYADIRLDGGASLSSVLAYTARPESLGRDVPERLNRSPLLVNGEMVRMSELDQQSAARLSGTPATTDGLDCEEVIGEPDAPGGCCSNPGANRQDPP
jgi:hypothetical protein